MAGASATKTRLFIPTPAGAVEILSLTAKAGTDRSRSAVLKRQSYEPLALSARYRQFVSDTGPLGLAGPMPEGRIYILQLSADIDGGDSWNLPVLLFHLIEADHDGLGAVSRTGAAVTVFATGSLAFDPRLSLRDQPLKAERYALEEKMKTWLKAAAPFSGKVLVLLPADAEADDLDRAEALARYALAGLASVVRCRTVGDAIDALAALAGPRKPAALPAASELAGPEPVEPAAAEPVLAVPMSAGLLRPNSEPPIRPSSGPAPAGPQPSATLESRDIRNAPPRGQPGGALSGSPPLSAGRPSQPSEPADRRSRTTRLAAVAALVAMVTLAGILVWRTLSDGGADAVAFDPPETGETGTSGQTGASGETGDSAAGTVPAGSGQATTAETGEGSVPPAAPQGSSGPPTDKPQPAETAGGAAPPPPQSSTTMSAEDPEATPPSPKPDASAKPDASPKPDAPTASGNPVAVEALVAPQGQDCAPLVFGTARPETVLLPAAANGSTFTVELPPGTCGIALTFPESWTVEWSADLKARRMSGLGGLIRSGGKANARILAKGATGFSGRTLTLEPPAAGAPGTPVLRVR